MPYAYRFIVQRLAASPLNGAAREMSFDATTHDEIIQLVDRIKSRQILPEDEAAAFTVGLKLFGEIMLRHRHEPLFAGLFPHFGTFMKRLKSDAPQASNQ
jgi:hypothetical protein